MSTPHASRDVGARVSSEYLVLRGVGEQCVVVLGVGGVCHVVHLNSKFATHATAVVWGISGTEQWWGTVLRAS